MGQAKNGNTVKVHFTGWLENGELFSDSKGGEPVEFTIGRGEFIPGFEKGIIGMEVGETRTITVLPEEAFGPRHEELVFDIKKSDFPVTPVIGKQFQIRQEAGDAIKVTIADIDEDTVTLDANHPLAGYTLTFTILLLAVS